MTNGQVNGPASASGGADDRVAVGQIAAAFGGAGIASVTFLLGMLASREAASDAWFAGLNLFILVMGGAIGSAVFGSSALLAVARARRRGVGSRFARMVGLVLGAGWAGFLTAVVVVAIAGPSVESRGTLHVELGPPFDKTADLPATCTSVVGDSHLLASIDADGPGYFGISLRDAAMRDTRWSVSTDFADRRLWVPDLGEDAQPGGRATIPKAFYVDTVKELVDETGSGRVALVFARSPLWRDAGGWPMMFEVRVDWVCPEAG